MKIQEEIVLIEMINERDDPLKLWIEPWCEELELPQGASWRMTGIGVDTRTCMVTIEFHDEVVVIHGVPEALMRLYADEKLIWECFEPFELPGFN